MRTGGDYTIIPFCRSLSGGSLTTTHFSQLIAWNYNKSKYAKTNFESVECAHPGLPRALASCG